ncbi:MAG: phosphate ABC transporter substrate-binding protein PstS [Deltaproteobacteria bacterium]|nr:phosphate ABC transporter substrate-binding protein PstS [Deltaproteobacteria bacterium]
MGPLCAVLTIMVPGISRAAETLLINGAGATFPYPLYSKWFYTYHQQVPSLQFNYQSIGSGGGIRQMTAGTVDFGASDAPMSDSELAAVSQPVLHIPTILGSVVLAYHQPKIAGELHLSGPVVAEIFLGKITKWNDQKLQALNPGMTLPDQAIFVVHRADGSGTTYIFTDYLSHVSPVWKTAVGTEKAVNWPVGLGGKGNEGVSALVKQTPGAIGYVELSYAIQNKMPMASLQNRSGRFITPSIASVTAAAAGVKMPADYRVSLVDPDGADAYPMSAFTYLLVYQQQKDARRGKTIIDFLTWAIHEGQTMAAPLHYAPLPTTLIKQLEATIAGITLPKG